MHQIQAPLSYLQVLTITQPPYLHNFISVQCPRCTRSSSVVTLARPPSSSSRLYCLSKWHLIISQQISFFSVIRSTILRMRSYVLQMFFFFFFCQLTFSDVCQLEIAPVLLLVLDRAGPELDRMVPVQFLDRRRSVICIFALRVQYNRQCWNG